MCKLQALWWGAAAAATLGFSRTSLGGTMCTATPTHVFT